MKSQKFIFVIGGVVSGLGKGITCASIAFLLKSSGIKVFVQKIDPYLNVDPGTINPIEHGEIFVTADGAETDLDLGHYERMANITTTKKSNITAGQVYKSVIEQERKGAYQGQTVQINPHVTTQIKNFILSADNSAEVLLCEVGGVAGDIESLPFIEAIRQLKFELGNQRVVIVGVGLLTFLSSTMELKTKPMQNSIRRFLELGISPDVWVIRSDRVPTKDVCSKISLYSSLNRERIFFALNQLSVYDLPMTFYQQGLNKIIAKLLNMPPRQCQLNNWVKFLDQVHQNFNDTVQIALIGKYVKLHDSYLSVIEALKAAAIKIQVSLKIKWISSEQFHSIESADKLLANVNGILIPGGFGERGVEGMIYATKYARQNKIPFLGICLGMQVAIIEFCRSVCGLVDADSSEFNPRTTNAVFHLIDRQRESFHLGGTLRLGNYPVQLKPGTLIYLLYQKQVLIEERHRHRYEFNNQFKLLLQQHGVVFSGIFPKLSLVETMELTDHPFFIGCQYHPEFKSRPFLPHPLFFGFLQAVKNQMLEFKTKCLKNNYLSR